MLCMAAEEPEGGSRPHRARGRLTRALATGGGLLDATTAAHFSRSGPQSSSPRLASALHVQRRLWTRYSQVAGRCAPLARLRRHALRALHAPGAVAGAGAGSRRVLKAGGADAAARSLAPPPVRTCCACVPHSAKPYRPCFPADRRPQAMTRTPHGIACACLAFIAVSAGGAAAHVPAHCGVQGARAHTRPLVHPPQLAGALLAVGVTVAVIVEKTLNWTMWTCCASSALCAVCAAAVLAFQASRMRSCKRRAAARPHAASQKLSDSARGPSPR